MATQYQPMTFSQGTHCKACDRLLSTKCPDPELCETCLAVVTGLNGDLYDNHEILLAGREISLSTEVE